MRLNSLEPISRWERSDLSRPRALTLSELEFSLPHPEHSSWELLRFADYLGLEEATCRGVYRLSLEKCATLGEDEIRRISRYGILLSEEVLREISRLRGEKIVNIDLWGGDLVLTATRGAEGLLQGYAEYEPKTSTYRSKPRSLWSILEGLQGRCRVKLGLNLDLGLSFTPSPSFRLRSYQARCYDAWRRMGFRGVIALPTAAGKTFLALQAISDLRVRTLIVVPFIELLHQWRRRLIDYLDIPEERIGVYGGGSREVDEVTIITYDSAYLNAEGLSGRFMLLVADEAHHSVAQEYRRIFDLSIARYRMGLTGTPLRSDGLHRDYEELIGPLIKTISEEELRREGYIAGYRVMRVYVDLDQEAMKEYERCMEIYEDYCRSSMPWVKDPVERFNLCLRRAARDPRAREALRARNRARMIALSGEEKVERVGELLSRYWDRKVLIFSRYVDVVREVSRRYLIPLIVAETSNEERRAILEMFRRGEVTKLASGMTLEEGLDVPDAEVGIIISGSGSNREYLQRIGRLLRPKMEEALVIELVTRGTLDQQLSSRRRRFRIWPRVEG